MSSVDGRDTVVDYILEQTMFFPLIRGTHYMDVA